MEKDRIESESEIAVKPTVVLHANGMYLVLDGKIIMVEIIKYFPTPWQIFCGIFCVLFYYYIEKKLGDKFVLFVDRIFNAKAFKAIYSLRPFLIKAVKILFVTCYFWAFLSFSNYFFYRKQVQRLDNEIFKIKKYYDVAKRPFLYCVVCDNDELKYNMAMTPFKNFPLNREICSVDNLSKIEEGIKNKPNFPFFYFIKAECEIVLTQNRDEIRSNYLKAKNILDYTTQIDGHHVDLDTILGNIDDFFKRYPELINPNTSRNK